MTESSSSEPKAYATLTPSQALGSSSRRRKKKNNSNGHQANAAAKESTNNNHNGESASAAAPGQSQKQPKQGNRNRRRAQKGPKVGVNNDEKNNDNAQGGGDGNVNQPNDASSNGNSATVATTAGPTKGNNPRKNRGRGNNKPKNNAAGDQQVDGDGAAPVEGNPPQGQGPQGKKNNKRNTSNKKQRKKYPWRRFIPAGTVDPITLESLISLEYPPFALVADAPYEPVPVWPIPEKGSEEEIDDQNTQIDIEELNRKRIAEQWGNSFENGDGKDSQETKPSAPLDPTKRHYNLYDGRALAYYIVSQLQFIDPLNRRDLTRKELVILDSYLRRHGFKDLNVTEAYDAKGVTISSAGAVAATAQGRADIMQQMARNLLNSLFGGHSVAAPVPTRQQEQSSVQEQYAALQRQEAAQHRPRQAEQGPSGSLNPSAMPFFVDNGVYTSEDGGLMVIDDDENPGMRGGDYTATRGYQTSFAAPGSAGSSMMNPFYSASHITARHGNGVASTANTDAFPALPTASAGIAPAAPAKAPPAATAGISSKPSAKPSKTLSRITGAVKKTDPEALQRQWEAREASRNRAMMANMSFGVDASIIDATQQQNGLLRAPPGISLEGPSTNVTHEKLQRNKAFADALGVMPSTVRQTINSGWTRPTDTKINLDEFGNELNATIYPDSLLSQARDRMGLLLKLEKKWKAFLKDDKAASLPLNPMDKPSRAFLHHYSDFWNLKTESFDPEPRRYIHCVKMLDTHMPSPLLSDATRKWRGPSALVIPTAPSSADRTSQQTAGQPSKSREIPPPPERVPLPLQPRSLAPGEQKGDATRPLLVAEIRNDVDFSGMRSGALLGDGRERPKVELAKRTVPLELPPFEPPAKAYDIMEAELMERKAKQEERARRAKAAEEQKRRAMEEAFASDDEEANGGDDHSSASVWEEPEALYQGSDSDA